MAPGMRSLSIKGRGPIHREEWHKDHFFSLSLTTSIVRKLLYTPMAAETIKGEDKLSPKDRFSYHHGDVLFGSVCACFAVGRSQKKTGSLKESGICNFWMTTRAKGSQKKITRSSSLLHAVIPRSSASTRSVETCRSATTTEH